MKVVFDFDTFLKVWAIVGPLLAAAVSAAWARHLQMNDRAHQDKKDEQRHERELLRAKYQAQTERQKIAYDDLKSAISAFLASSHQYALKQSEALSYPTDKNKSDASEALDQFIAHAQIIFLLGDDSLENATTEFWNLASKVPRAYDKGGTEEYEKILDDYKNARIKLTQEGKRVLSGLSG